MAAPIILIILLVGIDRALKVFLSPVLKAAGATELIPGVLGLNYAENTGAGFSILSGHTALLSVISGVALAVMLYILLFSADKNKLYRLSLILIIAGGFGNLYDRVFNGFVFDYLEFLFFEFPIFNFADCCITVGAVLLGIYMLFVMKTEQKGEDAS